MEDNSGLRLILPKSSQQPKSPTIIKMNRSRHRRESVSVACDACRKRKTACGGQQPSCDFCRKKGILCHYQRHPRAEKTALKEEVEVLRKDKESLIQENTTLREHQRDEVTTADSSSRKEYGELVMNAMNSKSLSESLSAGPSARASLPAIYSEIELSLHIQYPQAYPRLDLQDKTKIHSAYSYIRGLNMVNPSRIIPRIGDKQRSHLSYGREIVTEREPQQFSEMMDQGGSILPQPSLTNLVPDDILLLEDIDIRHWTNLPIPQRHILGAIRQYFETDHLILGMFDGKLFLRDFLSGSSDFCSSFLVTSFLACILHPYMIKEDPQSLLSKSFQTQAMKMWQDENNKPHDHINTVAGLVFLSHSLILSCNADFQVDILNSAVDMATRLHLFNVPMSISLETMPLLEGDFKQATAHVAWGTYNFITMHSHFNVLRTVDTKPTIPLPVRRTNDIAYLSSGMQSLSVSTSQTFIAMCKLCPHFVGMRRDRSGVGDQLTLALSRFGDMLAIRSEMSSDTTLGSNNTAACITFDIWYHMLIMDLFRPFVVEARQAGLIHWMQTPKLPEAIFSASLNQLIRLSIEFSTTQLKAALQNIWWHPVLMYIANATLQDPSNLDRRLLFLFSISCYQYMVSSYPCLVGTVKALLWMAADRQMLSLHEVRTILTTCEASLSRSERSFGTYTVDLDRALTLPEQAQVNTLTEQLDDLNFLDACTQDLFP